MTKLLPPGIFPPMRVRVGSLLCLFFLCGFHGCLNDRVGKTPHNLGSQRIGYVDTRLGTGGILWISGNHSPAAVAPFGMVKLGPDTASLGRVMGTAGYHYGDVWLKGFSHTRLVGAGIWEGGALRVLPANRALDYASVRVYEPPFRHDDEAAVPGHYKTYLYTEGIRAELTATPRVGLHRYHFERTTRPRFLIDLTSGLAVGGRVERAEATVDYGNQRVTGSFTLFDDFSQRYKGLPHFFALAPELPIRSHRFIRSTHEESATSTRSTTERLYLEIELEAPVNSGVGLRVALSYVDVAGAIANLAEAPIGTSFDAIRTATQNTWESWLARASVEGDEDRKKIFYTALYESLQMPTIFSDRDGRYRGFDKEVHTAAGYTYFSDFSLWDTFRTVHPLYHLIARDEQRQMALSLLRMAEQSGRLPRWASGGGHADSMLGHPAMLVLAESYLKGIAGFDINQAYGFFLKGAGHSPTSTLGGRECVNSYSEAGYCPWDHSDDSVSYTVEYAYADHAIAAVAERLRRPEEAAFFSQRAKSYRALWNSRHLALVPRARAGAFIEDFSLYDNSYVGLTRAAKHYREGGANHYRWYAPHDPEGLMALFGSSFLPLLSEFFQRAPQPIGVSYPSAHYWHGNEHDLHAVFFFNHAGRPDLTQRYTRWIHETKYDSTSIGLDGNDDGGTLSAWYVLTALGIFPIAGTTRYEITSPLFERAVVSLGGPELRVTATGASQLRYVRGVHLNGSRLPHPWLDHALLAGGGDLVFEMSESPSPWQGR